MKKMIGLLPRRSDMSPEQFREYWTTTHAEITAKVPGLRLYVQNICQPDENGEPAFDGVAVLAFDDMVGMQKAMGTPEWEAVMDDVPKFVDDSRIVIMIAEENVVVTG
jgi:uncharacterized protein (TIGR02118 family)